MQEDRTQVALRSRNQAHSLAERRAEFEARVREMATDDLKQVAKRLKALREELERKSGEPWRIQDVAEKAKIPLRTYAAWEGGENEARGGEGYKILARFYTRRLGRKVTWRWIVFGDEEPAKLPTPEEAQARSRPAEPTHLELQANRSATSPSSRDAKRGDLSAGPETVLTQGDRGSRQVAVPGKARSASD